MTTAPVVVLGGGPAGLGAALALAHQGRPVRLFEAGPRFGGLTASLEVGGQRVDVGSHRLHAATSRSTLSLLRGLLGDDLQLRRRNGRIRLFDRWVAFPLRAGDLARHLPPSFAVRAGASAVLALGRRNRDSSFADYVTSRLGPVLGREFYFPYARKIWGLPAEQISGEQARRRISADSPVKLAGKVLRPPSTGAGTFYYPAGGFGRISEALAQAARAEGAHLHSGTPVIALTPGDTGWIVSTAQGSAEGTVLSTVPLTTLAELLGLRRLLPQLRYRAMIVVYLVVAGAPYTEYDAHYLPGPFTPVTRISEPRNYRTPTATWPDPADTTVLCAEIPCDPRDDVWRMTDPELQELVIEALAACDMPAADVRDVKVLRREQAYPVYPLDYADELAPFLAEVARLPRLLTFGRQGLFAHDNTHHALDMAWAAAAAVRTDGTVDQALWAGSLAHFDGHVVED